MIEPKSSFYVFIVKDLDAAKSFCAENFGFNVVFAGNWFIHLVSKSGVQVGFSSQINLLSHQYSKSHTLAKELLSA